MADAPEIPEAKDRFEKIVALMIAVMAVVLSWISNFGDNAKTNAIIKTNEATNKWGHFQSKSVKERLIATSLEMAAMNRGSSESIDSRAEALRKEVERYRSEKTDLQHEAEKLQGEADLNLRINDRCDNSSLLLQVAIILSSVAILTRAKALCWISVVLAVVGALIGISSHFM